MNLSNSFAAFAESENFAVFLINVTDAEPESKASVFSTSSLLSFVTFIVSVFDTSVESKLSAIFLTYVSSNKVSTKPVFTDSPIDIQTLHMSE